MPGTRSALEQEGFLPKLGADDRADDKVGVMLKGSAFLF